MREHDVDCLYIKLFEVDAGAKHGNPDWRIVPVATTQFNQSLPSGIDVVPVVYITVDAVRSVMDIADTGEYNRYVKLFVDRIYDMMQTHWDGTLRQVQVDCDWTQSTRAGFFRFARAMQCELQREERNGAVLGGTVRLHQLQDKDIPFARKVLMCYNTGRLQDTGTRNSILDYDDVLPYLQRQGSKSLADYDIAWPVYGWGVSFDEQGHFLRITSPEPAPGVRVEWGDPDQIRKVRAKFPGRKKNNVILYHLDSANLIHYSYEDIEDIYSH